MGFILIIFFVVGAVIFSPIFFIPFNFFKISSDVKIKTFKNLHRNGVVWNGNLEEPTSCDEIMEQIHKSFTVNHIYLEEQGYTKQIAKQRINKVENFFRLENTL